MVTPRGRFDIRWDPEGRSPRKLSFRPTDMGHWRRVELVWNGCQWREVGWDRVENVKHIGDGRRDVDGRAVSKQKTLFFELSIRFSRESVSRHHRWCLRISLFVLQFIKRKIPKPA
ncbi:hypothetical protein HALLA_12220 [Halostagnicola larsenii XH-48]|uniref:Uncharacterized protein n=1 Tax=Halostagnicola larsenii XH-48 TaxID=797299 RepID=W0JUI3_9EURY|nr:hypothetical protein HALLA_12220 [Halostagnicola larsenii XH-48]